MKKKIQIITTLGPSSLNAAFLKFSNNNIDILRLNMSHIEPEELEEKIKFIRKFTKTNICVDTEGCTCKGVGIVLKSNVGIEYGIGVTLDRLGRITEQNAEVLN